MVGDHRIQKSVDRYILASWQPNVPCGSVTTRNGRNILEAEKLHCRYLENQVK